MLQTVTDIVTGAFQNILKNFLHLLTNPFDTIISQIIDALFKGVNSTFLTVFDNEILDAVLKIFHLYSWIIFLASLFFFWLKIAKETNKDWNTITTCFIEAFLFVTFYQWLAKSCFYLSCMLSQIFNFAVFGNTKLTDFIGPSYGISGFSAIIVSIAFLAFFVLTTLRAAHMFLQILIAPLYIPYVLMGDRQKWAEWFLGVVSIGFTYLVQYAVFYSGYMVLRFSGMNLTSKWIGIGILFSTFGVPKAMQKFGWSSGAGATFRTVGQTGMTLMMRMPFK